MSDSNKQTLSDRMKEYEDAFDYKMTRRCPVICRLDGRAFSNITRHLEKPDLQFLNCMANAALAVAKDLEGAVFMFTQSDEVTILLKNDQSNFSQPLFDNRIQKIVSICAAEMTYYFNKELQKINLNLPKACFDCRTFIVPSLIEAVNNFIARQRDCIRNSVSTCVDSSLKKKLGSKKAFQLLEGKKTKERIQILFDECEVDFWKDYPSEVIRGIAAYKILQEKMDNKGDKFIRNSWNLDKNIPEFEMDASLIIKAYDFIKEEKDAELF